MTPPLRILFFSSMRGSPWGGSEELWAAAAHRALDHAHAVAVCVFGWPGPPAPVARLRDRGATIIPRPLDPPRLAWLRGRPEWLSEIDQFRPDRVCLSQGAAFECPGRRATRPFVEWLARAGTPMVNVVQFNKPGVVLSRSVRALATTLYSLARCNAFVAARNIDEAAVSLGLTPIPNARVLRNPVNLADTTPAPWPAPSTDGPRFACVGRLNVRAKGQDLLLDALAARPWRREPWTLTLVGVGEDEPILRAQARRLDVADRVRFAGHAGDLRAVWASHDVLVLPSRAEGTPLAMVEAMLLGRPALVTDVGGSAEWVTEGATGWIAREANAAEIGAALDRAWLARARWPEMGAAARAEALLRADPNPGQTLLDVIVGPTPPRASP